MVSSGCYGVAAFIRYLDVWVSEYVSDLSYLQRNVCESCPFLVFIVVWCGVLFCVLFGVLVCVLLRVGSRSVGRYVELLPILFFVALF